MDPCQHRRPVCRSAFVLVSVLLLSACHPLLAPVHQAQRDSGQILPSVTDWESGAEHGAGVYLGLEIPDAQPGDPDYFVEPRNLAELFIVIQFAEPFPPGNFREATILVAENEAGTRSFTSASPESIDPETGRLYLRAPAPTGPTTIRIRIFDPTGVLISQRSFAVIPGDVNGDGVVNAADNEGPGAMDGVSADQDELAIRSDVDVNGVVSSVDDVAVIGTKDGDTSPGDPPDFDDPDSVTATISFDPDPAGLGVTGSTSAITDDVGETITLPDDSALDLAGYTFLEWNTEPDGSGSSYLPGPNLTLTGPNLTLYAQWSSGASTYTVTYNNTNADPGADTAPVDPNSYTTGATFTVAAGNELGGNLARAGFTLTGWDDGTNTYTPGDTYTVAATNVVFEPVWTFVFAGGTGTPGDPYQIDTPERLSEMRADLTASYALTGSVDLSSFGVSPGWDPIDVPSGATLQLNGNGHTITNLVVDRPTESNVGLFGAIDGASSVIIENLIIDTPNVSGANRAGVLIGDSLGTDSLSITNVAISNATVTAASGSAGGVAGRLRPTGTTDSLMVSGVVIDGTVTTPGNTAGGIAASVSGAGSYTIENVEATVGVEADAFAGGAFGQVSLTGTGRIAQSFAAGNVRTNASNNAGGFVAALTSGVIEESFAEGDVFSQTSTAGGFAGSIGLPLGVDPAVVRDSYSIGSVQIAGALGQVGGFAGRIDDSGLLERVYSSGLVVAAGIDIGGLVGAVPGSGLALESVYNLNSSGQSDSNAGSVGLSDADMRTQAIIQSGGRVWDFTAGTGVWEMSAGSEPYLQWQPSGTGSRP